MNSTFAIESYSAMEQLGREVSDDSGLALFGRLR